MISLDDISIPIVCLKNSSSDTNQNISDMHIHYSCVYTVHKYHTSFVWKILDTKYDWFSANDLISSMKNNFKAGHKTNLQ